MFVKRSLLTLCAGLCLAACAPHESAPAAPERPAAHPDQQPGADRPLTFRVVADGSRSPVGPAETVFRDAAAWETPRSALTDLHANPDFDREAVLLAAVDAPTGGYRVRFDSVLAEPGGAVRAHYTVEVPGPDCMVTQALTEPFVAVAVEALPEGPVRFVQQRATYSCE